MGTKADLLLRPELAQDLIIDDMAMENLGSSNPIDHNKPLTDATSTLGITTRVSVASDGTQGNKESTVLPFLLIGGSELLNPI
jgi:hypothetical protein